MREKMLKIIKEQSDTLYLLDSMICDILQNNFHFEFKIVTKGKKTITLTPTAGEYENIYRETLKKDIAETRNEVFQALMRALEELQKEKNQ